MVIALDSPTDPADGTDALFATGNHKAGVLIGQYAKAAKLVMTRSAKPPSVLRSTIVSAPRKPSC